MYPDDTNENLLHILPQLTTEEITRMRNAIVEGKVDGNMHTACLLGKAADGAYWELIERIDRGKVIDTLCPIEDYILYDVSLGHTPENNPKLAEILSWIDEFLAVPAK